MNKQDAKDALAFMTMHTSAWETLEGRSALRVLSQALDLALDGGWGARLNSFEMTPKIAAAGRAAFGRDRDRFMRAWARINRWRESVSGRDVTVRFVRRNGLAAERLGPHYTVVILRECHDFMNTEGVRVGDMRTKSQRGNTEIEALEAAAAWCSAQPECK